MAMGVTRAGVTWADVTRRQLAALAAGWVAGLALPATRTLAQAPTPAPTPTWPQRPVRFIVPLGPGSGADIGARLLADRLPARWGKPVVIESRPAPDRLRALTALPNPPP